MPSRYIILKEAGFDMTRSDLQAVRLTIILIM